MIDRDLAELYEVKAIVLRQQVKRNIKRFPEDFMFQLTKKETNELITNCDRLNPLKHSATTPYVFTEQGVAMLSSILNSDRAIEVNIQIMRTFARLKEFLLSHKEFATRLEFLEKKFGEHDGKIKIIFEGTVTALKLKDYLQRHLEIENKLTKKGMRKYYFTDLNDRYRKVIKIFLGDITDLFVKQAEE